MKNIIELVNVSKVYTHKQAFITGLFKKPKKFIALNKVKLTVQPGEMVAFVGENGAGKSTLFNIVTGITTPTTGKVIVRGKVAPLIDLNAGFHPDLTGRENIFINGLLLGMRKKEIEDNYEKIVDFAEIGDFINQPLSVYSDGMKLRLGFAIAVHSNPDILVIDEVMAVGDLKFRIKCHARLKKLRAEGKTFLFTNQSVEIIKFYHPERVVWLSHGKIQKIGTFEDIYPQYRQNQEENY